MSHRAAVPVLSGDSPGHSVGGGLPVSHWWGGDVNWHIRTGAPAAAVAPQWGVIVRVEARFGKEHDAGRLVAVFPRLAGCVESSVDVAQPEACVTAGMVTDTELEWQASSRDSFTHGP